MTASQAAPGTALTDLSFLSQVTEITGRLIIEDCDQLPNLNDLSKLRTIGGEPDNGLVILNNDMLTDFKVCLPALPLHRSSMRVWSHLTCARVLRDCRSSRVAASKLSATITYAFLISFNGIELLAVL